MINNSFSYLMVYIFGEDVQSYRDIFMESVPYLIFLAVALLVFAFCLAWLIMAIKKASHFNMETL